MTFMPISRFSLWITGLVWLSMLLAGCVTAPTSPPPLNTPTNPILIEDIPSATPLRPVISTGSATASATLIPAPAATETRQPPVRFAVIGDYGLAGPAEEQVARLVTSWQPDLIITTGDNNYPSGAPETADENIGQYYHAYIAPYTGAYGTGAEVNRFFPTLGNHDWLTDQGQAYFDYFSMPGNERYYEFTWGPLQVFMLNSDEHEPDGVGRSSAQAAWLQERLAAATLPWKVVYFHQPPYSSGYHGSVDWMRWPFKEWGASLVLAGHDHTYERLEIDGLTYIVNGIGGGPIYPFIFPLEGSLVRYNDFHGALLVEADFEQLSGTFASIDRTNSDQFGILIPVKP